MDNANRLPTRNKWPWVRVEQVTITLGLSALVVLQRREVNWERFLVAFGVIDIVGYLPGAIAFRCAKGGTILPIFYRLYNFTHNYLIAIIAAGLWAVAVGHVEW